MTVDTNVLARQIYEQARQLPPESLTDLAKYVEFLQFKVGDRLADEPSLPDGLRVVNLRGLFKGYDFSPELLAEARREMWSSLEEEIA
ncbi:MAG: hypothetical protein KDI07_04310 [Anaerolineae bacterium]|nr:hypothetical protein [Anaerolineae bacterium]MCB9131646.1 hypothetical protein [Anaerolineales bacterium]MCB0230606.1 hypothetical protein [Anaerolineae bacterium]MCB0233649.1 hypothetical protein [Anaerolineae bacterium]MCB0240914.1 hypothetical protein [Anaerolineae bacterium]